MICRRNDNRYRIQSCQTHCLIASIKHAVGSNYHGLCYLRAGACPFNYTPDAPADRTYRHLVKHPIIVRLDPGTRCVQLNHFDINPIPAIPCTFFNVSGGLLPMAHTLCLIAKPRITMVPFFSAINTGSSFPDQRIGGVQTSLFMLYASCRGIQPSWKFSLDAKKRSPQADPVQIIKRR